MPSTRYRVFTEFLLRDGRLQKGLRTARRHTRELNRSVKKVSTSFGRLAAMGAGVGAAFGLYMGLREAKRALIDYNDKMEQLRISIGGATSMMVRFDGAATGAENYARAMDMARSSVAVLREDAAKLIGTTEDFTGAFSMLVGPMAQTGLAKTDRELKAITRDMVGLSVAAGATLMEGDISTGVSQITRMILGMAGAEMRMAQILQITGDAAEKFNRMSVADRYKEIHKRLSDLKPAFRDFETSWQGVTTTFADQAQLMLGKVGEPVFGALKNYLRKTNVWLQENETSVNSFADALGNRLSNAVSGWLDQVDPTKTSFDEIGNKVQGMADKMSYATRVLALFGKGALLLPNLIVDVYDEAAAKIYPKLYDLQRAYAKGDLQKEAESKYSTALNAMYQVSDVSRGAVLYKNPTVPRYEKEESFDERYYRRFAMSMPKTNEPGWEDEELMRYRMDHVNRMAEAVKDTEENKEEVWRQLSSELLNVSGGFTKDELKMIRDDFVRRGFFDYGIRSNRAGKGSGKNIKIKPAKIEQHIGMVKLDLRIEKLEDLEPDRIAVAVRDKVNRDLARGGSRGLTGLLRGMG